MPCARIKRDNGRFAAIPARPYLYKTTGRQVFSDIDLRLLHDTEAGEGPVMYDVAIIDAQQERRPQDELSHLWDLEDARGRKCRRSEGTRGAPLPQASPAGPRDRGRPAPLAGEGTGLGLSIS